MRAVGPPTAIRLPATMPIIFWRMRRHTSPVLRHRAALLQVAHAWEAPAFAVPLVPSFPSEIQPVRTIAATRTVNRIVRPFNRVDRVVSRLARTFQRVVRRLAQAVFLVPSSIPIRPVSLRWIIRPTNCRLPVLFATIESLHPNHRQSMQSLTVLIARRRLPIRTTLSAPKSPRR